MQFNKYFPFAFIYFFINAVALPFGLTYTALLGPFFYVWVVVKRKKEILLPFVALIAPFIVVQLFVTGVDHQSYSITWVNLVMIYFFCHAVYYFLILSKDPEKIFRRVLIINTILCLIAIVFYFTPWDSVFWIKQNLTEGVDQFRRLKLLTYEASHYALLFVPLFGYFLLQYLLHQNKLNNGLLLFMLFLPLVLSFSLGVIGCLLIALLLLFIFHFNSLSPKRRVVNAFISATAFLCVFIFVMIFFFRDNAIFLRIGNILFGYDSSGEGRTSNAFLLANRILEDNNAAWFGIGPGQLKIVGEDIIRGFYLYYEKTPVAIPNAAAETLLVFGWVGLGLRFFIEILFFVYTKVWKNYFRLLLFLFMLFYQFTGSYITNPAEYVIWIFAFTPVFKQFESRNYSRFKLRPFTT